MNIEADCEERPMVVKVHPVGQGRELEMARVAIYQDRMFELREYRLTISAGEVPEQVRSLDEL